MSAFPQNAQSRVSPLVPPMQAQTTTAQHLGELSERPAPPPPLVVIVFLSWLIPVAFVLVDGMFAPHGRAGLLIPVAVMSFILCVPVTVFMCVCFALLVRVTAPALTRFAGAISLRFRRAGMMRKRSAATPAAALITEKVAPKSLAVPLGAILGAAVGFLHVTGWFAYDMFSHRSMFFICVATTGAVVGGLFGVRHDRRKKASR